MSTLHTDIQDYQHVYQQQELFSHFCLVEENFSYDPCRFSKEPMTCGLLHVLDLYATAENCKAKSLSQL
jgi:hypothetical protein